MFKDASDAAPYPQGKPHQYWCVYDNEGTLKQFSDTFHTHAKNHINSLKILSLKFLQKEARASFRPSETTISGKINTDVRLKLIPKQ